MHMLTWLFLRRADFGVTGLITAPITRFGLAHTATVMVTARQGFLRSINLFYRESPRWDIMSKLRIIPNI